MNCAYTNEVSNFFVTGLLYTTETAFYFNTERGILRDSELSTDLFHDKEVFHQEIFSLKRCTLLVDYRKIPDPICV